MFDSHCHLTDDRFAGDLDEVLARAWDAGLTGLVTIASNVADARTALHLASRDPRIHATAGIHPHEAEHARPADYDTLRELAAQTGVVAIGETGLDFHYDNSPRETQRTVFDQHLRIAADTGLPVVVHSRSADEDTAAMIRGAGVTGVLHCFAGKHALFDTALAAGWFISFAGLITFRNFDNADLLRATPADRLLLETDSPYLAPVPHRGRRNEPAFVVDTCRAAALLRTEDAVFTAATVTSNAYRFYGLGAPSPA
ncbi:MAG TPA: TatD family hydrolase [Longimicrobiales bacterium]|nr:TatD family hydrolase [Longimicrobiales bacterium]